MRSLKKIIAIASISLALVSCGGGQVAVSGESGWVKGNAASTIVLAEYSDLQCPACRAAEPAVEAIMKEFGNQIRFEYHHFPLKAIHKHAEAAAMAAEAAGMQGKFWEI